jgi:hypothetical protein
LKQNTRYISVIQCPGKWNAATTSNSFRNANFLIHDSKISKELTCNTLHNEIPFLLSNELTRIVGPSFAVVLGLHGLWLALYKDNKDIDSLYLRYHP